MQSQEVFAIEVCALGMSHFHIKHVVVDKPEAGEGIDVEAVGISIGAAGYEIREGIPVVLYDSLTFGVGIFFQIGFFDVDRQVETGVVEFAGVAICVEFEEDGIALIGQVDTVVGEAHLLGEVVAAAIFAIEIEFDRKHIVGRFGSGQIGHLHGHGIGHHRAPLLVGQQHPALAGGEAERLALDVELDAIGIFAVRVAVPAGVASASNADAIGEVGPNSGPVDGDFGTQVNFLAGNHLSVDHVDIDFRHHCGRVGGPSCFHRHFTAVGHPRILPLCRTDEHGLVAAGLVDNHLAE